MAAFRIFDKLRTFYGQSGQLLSGGELRFYEAGTTTPQDVYGNSALSVNNGATVSLDSSGRPSLDIWANTADAYFVEVYDSADVKQGEIDDVEVPGGAGQTIPVPDSGEFLTGDGTNFLTATIREVPDPTGQADKVLSSDGTVLNWIAKPANGADASNVGSTATEYHVGNMYTVTGTATGTSVGGRTQSVAVTFATAFTSTPVSIDIEVTSSTLSSAGNMPSWAIISKSTTGFTVKFTMGEQDDSQSKYNFNAGVAFAYKATGVRTS